MRSKLAWTSYHGGNYLYRFLSVKALGGLRMGLWDWEKLKGHESREDLARKAADLLQARDLNNPRGILLAIEYLPARERVAVYEGIGNDAMSRALEIAQREAKVEEKNRLVEETKQRWIAHFEEEREDIEELKAELDARERQLKARLQEAEDIKARAYNAMKAAERIKRKAQKKIADFEALVDR